jgi:hypothetical protein
MSSHVPLLHSCLSLTPVNKMKIRNYDHTTAHKYAGLKLPDNNVNFFKLSDEMSYVDSF